MKETPMERCRPMFFHVLFQTATKIRSSTSKYRRTAKNDKAMSMYLDKDSRGIYGFHDITFQELSSILSILSTYRNPREKELESIAFQTFMCIEHQLLKIEANDRPETVPPK